MPDTIPAWDAWLRFLDLTDQRWSASNTPTKGEGPRVTSKLLSDGDYAPPP